MVCRYDIRSKVYHTIQGIIGIFVHKVSLIVVVISGNELNFNTYVQIMCK